MDGAGGACGGYPLYSNWTQSEFSYLGSGFDGSNGQDCGNVNILNDITVFAYGGKGGSSCGTIDSTMGSGGGGYPAAGIGGGGAGGGGCDNGTGAGGYSSSASDDDLAFKPAYNGLTPLGLEYSSDYISNWRIKGSCGGTGASYYQSGLKSVYTGIKSDIPAVGGQGGLGYGWFVGGCGGVAGKGGTIKVSSTAKIYAYNGNRITNEDYTNLNANYDVSTLITENGMTFVEAKNYAQSGVLRAIYCITAKWGEKPNHNYNYFKTLFDSDCAITGDYSNPLTHDATYTNICVRNEKNITPLLYINAKTGNNQGIGSGFGYIELSNGTYQEE